jgi:hypothetical protein
MTEIAPRIRRLESDPGFQELLADESVRARLQSGDTLALLTDPRIQALAQRVAE